MSNQKLIIVPREYAVSIDFTDYCPGLPKITNHKHPQDQTQTLEFRKIGFILVGLSETLMTTIKLGSKVYYYEDGREPTARPIEAVISSIKGYDEMILDLVVSLLHHGTGTDLEIEGIVIYPEST